MTDELDRITSEQLRSINIEYPKLDTESIYRILTDVDCSPAGKVSDTKSFSEEELAFYKQNLPNAKCKTLFDDNKKNWDIQTTKYQNRKIFYHLAAELIVIFNALQFDDLKKYKIIVLTVDDYRTHAHVSENEDAGTFTITLSEYLVKFLLTASYIIAKSEVTGVYDCKLLCDALVSYLRRKQYNLLVHYEPDITTSKEIRSSFTTLLRFIVAHEVGHVAYRIYSREERGDQLQTLRDKFKTAIVDYKKNNHTDTLKAYISQHDDIDSAIDNYVREHGEEFNEELFADNFAIELVVSDTQGSTQIACVRSILFILLFFRWVEDVKFAKSYSSSAWVSDILFQRRHPHPTTRLSNCISWVNGKFSGNGGLIEILSIQAELASSYFSVMIPSTAFLEILEQDVNDYTVQHFPDKPPSISINTKFGILSNTTPRNFYSFE